MRRVLLLLLCGAGLAVTALAQQSAESVPAASDADATVEESVTEATAEPAAETAPESAEAAEPVVDDVYYQDVDDKDFRPSEDIPADQSIPFPSDI